MRGAENRQDWRNVKGTIQGIYGLYKNAHMSGRHYATRHLDYSMHKYIHIKKKQQGCACSANAAIAWILSIKIRGRQYSQAFFFFFSTLHAQTVERNARKKTPYITPRSRGLVFYFYKSKVFVFMLFFWAGHLFLPRSYNKSGKRSSRSHTVSTKPVFTGRCKITSCHKEALAW